MKQFEQLYNEIVNDTKTKNKKVIKESVSNQFIVLQVYNNTEYTAHGPFNSIKEASEYLKQDVEYLRDSTIADYEIEDIEYDNENMPQFAKIEGHGEWFILKLRLDW